MQDSLLWPETNTWLRPLEPDLAPSRLRAGRLPPPPDITRDNIISIEDPAELRDVVAADVLDFRGSEAEAALVVCRFEVERRRPWSEESGRRNRRLGAPKRGSTVYLLREGHGFIVRARVRRVRYDSDSRKKGLILLEDVVQTHARASAAALLEAFPIR